MKQIKEEAESPSDQDAQDNGGGAPLTSRRVDVSAHGERSDSKEGVLDNDERKIATTSDNGVTEVDETKNKKFETKNGEQKPMKDEVKKVDGVQGQEKLDVSANGETPNSKGGELDQGIISIKHEDQHDDIGFDQDKKKIAITRGASESLRGVEKKENFETKCIEQTNHVQGEEKQSRKMRGIMNEKQHALMQKALLDEPEMLQNKASLQKWADTLSAQGSTITFSQLRNWIYRRNAKQRAHAAREAHAREEKKRAALAKNLKPGQFVRVVNESGRVVGTGRVFQVEGRWHGLNDNIEDIGVCIVDVKEVKGAMFMKIPYPSESGGRTFGEAANLNKRNGGSARVAWDVARVQVVR